MKSEILNSYRIILDFAHRMLADIPHNQWFAQPLEGMNHPGWIVGHLTYSHHMIGIEMGLTAWLPEDWGDYFAADGCKFSDVSEYRTVQQLLEAFDDATARIQARLSELGDDGLAGQLPDKRYRDTFPTLGHAVIHILMIHTPLHLGQFSAWRAAMGLPCV